jgi:ABC-type glycerol-3-phosphate transport system substrate-binding protein
MIRMRSTIMAALALPVLLAACGGGGETSPAEPASEPTTTSEVSSETSTDPLEGVWTTTFTPEAADEAAAAAELETTVPLESLFGATGPVTIVLTFENGQMVHTSAVNGGEPEVGWVGAYEILDEDSFVAGDSGDLYIEYTYAIDGDHLTIDMVRDDYPTASEEELASEIYAQTVIYESTPFTRES